jgi:hypothetical protein
MASKATWEEIKASSTEAKAKSRSISPGETPQTANEAFWPHLCGAWGIADTQQVFCREKAGHGGMHFGLRDRQTRIGWRA